MIENFEPKFLEFLCIFRKIDIFIGALSENLITREHLIASRAYYYDSLTWCVQKRQSIPKWRNIFYYCQDPLVYWMYTVVVVAILSVTYYLQKCERRKKWDWHRLTVEGFCGSVGFPCTWNPENISNRVVTIFVLFAVLILNVVFNVGISLSILTPIMNPQIRSIQEIIDGNFKLMGDQSAMQKIIHRNEIITQS